MKIRLMPSLKFAGPGRAMFLGCWLVVVTALLSFALGGGGRLFSHPSAEVQEFLWTRVSQRTRVLYEEQLGRFYQATGLQASWLRLPPAMRDNAVAHYLVRAYHAELADRAGDDSLSRTQAGYLLSSLKHADPTCSYPVAHHVFTGWAKKDPPSSAWPLTEELCTSCATLMAYGGQCMAGVCLMTCLALRARRGILLRLSQYLLEIPLVLCNFSNESAFHCAFRGTTLSNCRNALAS